MINSAVITGRLTKEIDLRYLSNGDATASFIVAVNRKFTNQSGEREADFINCVAWKKTAEVLANHTSKGSLIGVEGRIQTRSYENQQGQRVYVTEVVTESITFLENKSNKQQSNNSDQQSNQNNNYNSGAKLSDPFQNSGQPIDISDDDLPF